MGSQYLGDSKGAKKDFEHQKVGITGSKPGKMSVQVFSDSLPPCGKCLFEAMTTVSASWPFF